MNIKMEALIARRIGLVLPLNAVVLLHELSAWNQEETNLENLVLSLGTDFDLVESRTWHIDSLNAGYRQGCASYRRDCGRGAAHHSKANRVVDWSAF